MKVRIHLQSKNLDTTYFDIVPHGTLIARKWFIALQDVLKNKLMLEKNFCWVGFPDNPRQLSYLCKSLNYYIQKVNDYSDRGGWKKPYSISERYFPENVLLNGDVNQELMNSIHHHFEVLQGQVWNISPWFLEANDEVRYAIRQLNNLCHEIEILIKAKQTQNVDPERVSPASIISFLNCPRFDLAREDYEHFSLDRGFGKVFMHYCQTGKIHWEAFVDNDKEIDRSNINGLRYYSGEFNIEWGPTYHDGFDWWVQKKENYRQWLRNNNYDPNDKFLSHGWLEIGQVDATPLFEKAGSTKISAVHKLLANYLDINRIEALDGDQSFAYEYNTNWSDDAFHNQQLDTLSQSYETYCKNSGKPL